MPGKPWPAAKEIDIGDLATMAPCVRRPRDKKPEGIRPARIWALLMGWVLICGCGVKGPPSPLWPPMPLPAVSDLAYRATDGQVTLTWRLLSPLEDKAAGQAFFIVRRFQVSLDQPTCETCPRVYKTVARIPYVLTDDAAYSRALMIEAGYRYAFTVHLQSGQDVGPDCDPVQFDHPSQALVAPVEKP